MSASEHEITLFTNRTRRGTDPKAAAETSFTFLDRVAGPYWDQVRSVMNAWIANVPGADRVDLVARLRSKHEAQRCAALLELYLHETYLRSGWEVEIHPEVGGARHPDFRVQRHSEVAYVEATHVVDESDAERGERKRSASVRQALDGTYDPNFSIWLDIRRVGANDLGKRRLLREVRQWLSVLDPGEVEEVVRTRGIRRGPFLEWEHEDWLIHFWPVPKADRWRGVDDGAPGVAAESLGDVGVIDEVGPVRRALESKGSAYGELDGPLIIAVGIGEFAGRDDDVVMAALFGSETIVVSRGAPAVAGRAEDGFWYGGDRWRHPNVSAVLSVVGLREWTLASKTPTLPHHPEPTQGIVGLDAWRELKPGDTEMIEHAASIPPHSLFGLERGWPIGTPFPDRSV